MLSDVIHDAQTVARFWRKVDRRGPDECWEWSGRRDKDGYGQFRTNNPRRMRRANIVAHEIEYGLPNGLQVCHSCDNPPCCNPQHLWGGTNSDNQQDSVTKGRRPEVDQKGENNPRAILSGNDVIEIRRLIGVGLTNTKIGPMYGVTHSMISRIRLGKAWTHIK